MATEFTPETIPAPTTLFVVGVNYPGEGPYHLMAENGEHLYSHWCSHKSYAKGDLIETRESRKVELAKKFGRYEVVMLQDEKENQTGMNVAEMFRRNKAWFESLTPAEQAGVEIRHDEGYGEVEGNP